MNFAVIGSCAGSNTISFASDKGWRVVSNHVNLPTLALIDAYSNNIFIDKSQFDISSPDLMRAIEVANNEVVKTIKEKNPDCVLIDMFDFRLTREIYTVEVEGKQNKVATIRLNDDDKILFKKILEDSTGGKVVKVDSKNLDMLSDEEVKDYVERFVRMLDDNFSKEKVLFFKPKAVNQYLDNGVIKFVDNYQDACNMNQKIERVYAVLEGIKNVVLPPKNLIGNAQDFSPFMYHYCKQYYQYLIENIENFAKKRDFNVNFMQKTLNYCENEIHKTYNKVFCLELLDTIKNKMNKDIILIAKTKQFAEMLKESRGKDISVFIEYNENSDISQIEKEIKNVKRKFKNPIYVVPELFNNYPEKTLIQIFYENDYRWFIDFFLIKEINLYLENIIGTYTDIYNNKIETQTKINLSIVGHAITCKIGKNLKYSRISLRASSCLSVEDDCIVNSTLYLWQSSFISIGEKTSIAGGNIATCLLSRLIIGKDVMMSTDEAIQTGDGHPIWFKDEKQSYKHMNNCVKDEIIIGDHVWIGYRCIIIKGANIGSGSVIGAGSLVNKKIPNNVVAVGAPAKVIKRDVAWVRDAFITQLAQDEMVLEKYSNETED